MIDEMTYSWVNATAIREEMDQFNDTIKLFMSTHEEYQILLIDAEQAADSEWHDQFDEKVFSFKHKMVKWLKEAELNNEEVKSRMSCKLRSSRVVNLGALKVAPSQGTREVQRSAWRKEQLRRTSELLR